MTYIASLSFQQKTINTNPLENELVKFSKWSNRPQKILHNMIVLGTKTSAKIVTASQ